MRWSSASAVAGLIAVVIGCGTASAQDALDIDVGVSEPASDQTFWASLFDPRTSRRKQPFDVLSGGMPERLIYYAGLDMSHWSLGAYVGAQWMPAGINREGFILRMTLSESIDRYSADARSYQTEIVRTSIMPGYLFKLGNLEVQLLAGLDAEADFFFVDRRANKWRTKSGLRGVADVWWEPTRLLMLQSSLSATTIDNGYTTRVAAGVRLFNEFWIGPEAALSSDYFSQQTRIGGHVTGLRTGPYEWSLAGGYVRDSFQREGVYGRLGIVLRPPRQPFFEN